MLICALRSHLAEFGVVTGQGKGNFAKLVAHLESEEGARCLISRARRCARSRPRSPMPRRRSGRSRSRSSPGIVTTRRADASRRSPASGRSPPRRSRQPCPTPRSSSRGASSRRGWGSCRGQNSTGGKERLGRITKTGNRYIRRLLVIGATGHIRYRRTNVPGGAEWVNKLLAHKPVRLVTVALANKMARIAWAVLCRGEIYREAAVQDAAAMPAA